MADEFIAIPITADESAIYLNAVARLQETFPNWVPKPGGFLDTALRIIAGMAAPGAEIASSVQASIFRYFGTLVNIPPVDPTPAQSTATFVVKDTNGYTIPSGTPLGVFSSTSSNNPVGFHTVGNSVIAPGGDTALAVPIIADDPGSAGSGLNAVIRADSLGYVVSVTVDSVTTNGTDGEDDSTYLNRLQQELQTMSPTPILARDFALIARQIGGVFRVGFLDNYNPDDGTFGNGGYVALSAIDGLGNGVSAPVKAAIVALLESMREVNFVVKMVDPTITAVDINYTATAIPNSGFDAATLEAQVSAALGAYINKANWGIPQPPSGEQPVWINTPVVRINKIIQIIENIAVIDFANAGLVTMRKGTDAFASTDITLPGAFPLPTLGTVTGTVILP